jgi:hypothetical protein
VKGQQETPAPQKLRLQDPLRLVGLRVVSGGGGRSDWRRPWAKRREDELALKFPYISLCRYNRATGTLEATNGGLLDVATALSGAGQIAVGAASAVELGVATNENANFLGASNSKLRIDNATTTAYTGTIGNFTAGEILELGSTVATSATPTLNGSNTTLTVNLSGG